MPLKLQFVTVKSPPSLVYITSGNVKFAGKREITTKLDKISKTSTNLFQSAALEICDGQWFMDRWKCSMKSFLKPIIHFLNLKAQQLLFHCSIRMYIFSVKTCTVSIFKSFWKSIVNKPIQKIFIPISFDNKSWSPVYKMTGKYKTLFPVLSLTYLTRSHSFKELRTANCNCNTKHVHWQPYIINVSSTSCVKSNIEIRRKFYCFGNFRSPHQEVS